MNLLYSFILKPTHLYKISYKTCIKKLGDMGVEFIIIDLKKYGVLSLLLMILFLSMGLVCASQNLSDNATTTDCDEIHTGEYLGNVSDEQLIQSHNFTGGEIFGVNSDDDGDNQEILRYNTSSKTANSRHFSTNIEYEQLTKQYTPGITIYRVNVYDVYKSGDTQIKKPLKVQLKLMVYNGKSNKIYAQKSNANGLATFRIPNLAVGNYKVRIYVHGEKRGESTIKINRAQAKVTAPAAYVKHNRNNYFRMNVLDGNGNPIKKLLLKVKVYTGKKYKTFTIRTFNNGNAFLQTKNFPIGVHKIVISSENRCYRVSNTTKIIVKTDSYGKIHLSFDSIKVLHKRNNYFTVKATNAFGNSVENVAVKFVVFTGHSNSTYTVKTNKYGYAKIQTKILSLGTHKIKISAGNVKSNAYVLVVNKITAPKLVSLLFYPKANGEYYVKLKFNSQKFGKYHILKKTSNSFRGCAVVKATSNTTIFCEKVKASSNYSYSVREIINSPGGRFIYSSYDLQGLKMLTKPKVSVKFQNIQANIKWNKVEGASKYIVYRKLGANGALKCIAVVNSNNLTYSEVYSKSDTQLGSLISKGDFLDLSFNKFFYTVRAYSKEGSKISCGLYGDGVFHLESPTIISLKNNQITWSKVMNAEGYKVLKKISGVWKEIARIKANPKYTISYSFNVNKKSYYSVQAYAHYNGHFVYSGFDEGFSLVNYDYSNKNRILYLGDSITYGSKHIFSFPYRVAQLIGGVYYNPSVPGSTYHDLGVNSDGTNVENVNVYRHRITREVVDRIYDGKLPPNWEKLGINKNSAGETNTCLADYNIIVLSAGTNDYSDDSKLGDINSNETSTFHGALNHILEKIENASKKRLKNGKDPIKVVFVDLFYAEKNFNDKISNRDTTPNHIGLTLMDYQNVLNAQYDKWKNSNYVAVYKFKTRDYNIVNKNNIRYTTADNLHFTRFTYGQYGNALAKFLVKEVF